MRYDKHSTFQVSSSIVEIITYAIKLYVFLFEHNTIHKWLKLDELSVWA